MSAGNPVGIEVGQVEELDGGGQPLGVMGAIWTLAGDDGGDVGLSDVPTDALDLPFDVPALVPVTAKSLVVPGRDLVVRDENRLARSTVLGVETHDRF